MYQKKEIKVSMYLVVYKHELEATKYSESELEVLIQDVLNGEFERTSRDGPIWVESIDIQEIDTEWKVEEN